MYLWAFHFLNKGQNENFVENVCQDDSFFDGLLISQDFWKSGDLLSMNEFLKILFKNVLWRKPFAPEQALI